MSNCKYFGKAIYYGKYECIEKPNNTYFVINDDIYNTGVIKNCHEACYYCFGEGNEINMNCINCSQDYYKTEDSNTNYYNYSLLQNNKYYFNLEDSTFHHCYYTCSECLNSAPNETNHNCIDCAENYYKLKWFIS